MFFCQPCSVEKDWPVSFSTSYGKCEVCGVVRHCYNVPSKFLPVPPKPPQTWSIPTEPGPEVTHVKDRYRAVWQKKESAWFNSDGFGRPWPILFGSGYPLTDVSAEYGVDRDLFDDVE